MAREYGKQKNATDAGLSGSRYVAPYPDNSATRGLQEYLNRHLDRRGQRNAGGLDPRGRIDCQ